jgi:N-acetylneuraminic acid mutarotase
MNSRRSWHTATLLPNGKVLVTGGLNSFNIPLALAELYDPVAGTWTYTGSLSVGRELHTATLLPNGKVLVTGGYTFTNSNYAPVAAAELYDPATGTWTLTGPMGAARYQHTATLLPNGHVMAVGGYGTNTGNAYLTSAELYDPATGTWTNTVPLFFATAEHTATLLPDGQVMVAGGLSSLGVLATTEFYDPATGSWAILAGHMNTARRDHTATLQPNGEVLVVAGSNDITGEVSSAELYDPVCRDLDDHRPAR